MKLMQKIRSKFHKQVVFLSGAGAVCLFYLAWCCATISYQGKLYAPIHLILMVLSAVCYAVCSTICAGHERTGNAAAGEICKLSSGVRRQLQILNAGAFGAVLLLLIYDIRAGGFGAKENLIYYILADAVWLLSTMRNFRTLQYEPLADVKRAFSCVRKHIPLVLLLMAALLLAIEPGRLQFRWDGALYEQVCRAMNIHSLSSLGAYGHLSQAYGGLYCLLFGLIGNTGIAMAVFNILLYIGSIVAFYALLGYLFRGRRRYVYLAGTAVYAFSPFLLGMVNYYSLDYMTLCMFVWMIYFAFTEKWVLHFIAAVCFVFTKEPAFVVYGTFCVGLVISEFLRDRGCRAGDRIRHLFCGYQYYLMLLTGMFWVMTYLLIGGWSGGVGEFEMDYVYVLDKLKVLYVLNFNWLMTAVIVLGGGILIIAGRRGGLKKEKPELWWLPLLFSLLAFTVFSAAFKTVNHARYAAAAPVILYLFAFGIISRLANQALEGRRNGGRPELIKGVLISVCAGLMLVSSYCTIDPVSLMCFQQVDIGDGIMLTTGSPVIGDSMIYNKQMLYEEYALNQAFSYAIERGYQIYIPTYDSKAYAFDGLMLEVSEYQDDYFQVIQQWDAENQRRTSYGGAGTVPIVIRELTSESALPDLTDTDMQGICYIYSKMLGEDTAQQLMRTQENTEQMRFSYRGWELYALVIYR